MQKFLCSLIILLFYTCPTVAQEHNIPFPGSFIGKWKGNMQWIVAGKSTQIFTMQLLVKPTDTNGIYTWQIIYGDDHKDNRPYLLKAVDSLKNHWLIDENNGIILDNYVFSNCLKGAFTVMGNTIANNYCLENGELKVEFTTIKLADKTTSGSGTDDSPFVDSYRISSYQVGTLRKVNSEISIPGKGFEPF